MSQLLTVVSRMKLARDISLLKVQKRRMTVTTSKMKVKLVRVRLQQPRLINLSISLVLLYCGPKLKQAQATVGSSLSEHKALKVRLLLALVLQGDRYSKAKQTHFTCLSTVEKFYFVIREMLVQNTKNAIALFSTLVSRTITFVIRDESCVCLNLCQECSSTFPQEIIECAIVLGSSNFSGKVSFTYTILSQW